MLKVKTRLSQSNIPGAGIGLFSLVKIKAGSRVCEKGPGTYDIYTDEELKISSPEFCRFVQDFGYHVSGEWRLDKDAEKYINHSRNPNISPEGFALRDIIPGEELLYDYRQIDDKIAIDPPHWV